MGREEREQGEGAGREGREKGDREGGRERGEGGGKEMKKKREEMSGPWTDSMDRQSWIRTKQLQCACTSQRIEQLQCLKHSICRRRLQRYT